MRIPAARTASGSSSRSPPEPSRPAPIRDENLFVIPDRVEAIGFAVSNAAAGDTVLCAGKGHEKTLETATGEIPWDERAVATAAIRRRLTLIGWRFGMPGRRG